MAQISDPTKAPANGRLFSWAVHAHSVARIHRMTAEVLTPIVTLVVGWLGGNYFPSYFGEKGKNLATKEDIGVITREIEKNKNLATREDIGAITREVEKNKNLATKEDIGAITREVESVKAAMASQLHVHQIRYKNEFDILLALSEKLVEARDAAQSLRPTISYGDPDDEDARRARMSRYLDAGRVLAVFMESRQPFFPETIYRTWRELDQAAWREFVQFKNDPKRVNQKYWDNAEENQTMIGALATVLQGQIRDRIQRWEQFDAAP